jgi:putative transposase
VEEGLTEMFVAGVSTAKVGEVAQALIGVAPSKSAVSRMNAELSGQLEQWRQRKLTTQWQIIYLDGVYYKVRHGDEAVSMPLLVALGADKAGHKEVLAVRASAEESKEGWQLLLEGLRSRGVQQVGVFVTDGNEGVLAALARVFPLTPRQRCLLHIPRSVRSAIPKGESGKSGWNSAGFGSNPLKREL